MHVLHQHLSGSQVQNLVFSMKLKMRGCCCITCLWFLWIVCSNRAQGETQVGAAPSTGTQEWTPDCIAIKTGIVNQELLLVLFFFSFFNSRRWRESKSVTVAYRALWARSLDNGERSERDKKRRGGGIPYHLEEEANTQLFVHEMTDMFSKVHEKGAVSFNLWSSFCALKNSWVQIQNHSWTTSAKPVIFIYVFIFFIFKFLFLDLIPGISTDVPKVFTYECMLKVIRFKSHFFVLTAPLQTSTL